MLTLPDLTGPIRLVVAERQVRPVMMFLSSFIFGLIFGSFLNVVICRLKTPPGRGGTAKGIIFGRSFCPECKSKLRWYDLFPLLSFIFLRGCCRYCNKNISWQYPIVEILSGLIWVSIFCQNFNNNFQFSIFNFQSITFLYQIFIFSTLLIIAVYDFKWKIIPDKVIYPAITIALIYNIFSPDKGGLWGGLLTAVAAFLFFYLIFYFSKGKAMGMGDAKLAILIGLFLSPKMALMAFVLAFVIGAVSGIILMVFDRKTLKSQIAFGPFVAIGATIVFFFSSIINNIIVF